MTLIKPHLTSVLIVLASTAVALVAAEGTCRLIGYPSSPRSGWQWAESPYKSEANKSENRVKQLGLGGGRLRMRNSTTSSYWSAIPKSKPDGAVRGHAGAKFSKTRSAGGVRRAT